MTVFYEVYDEPLMTVGRSTIIGQMVEDVARTALAPLELPAGVLTAALGGPFFLYLLKTRQGDFGVRR